jgi:hypothetical protein
MREREEPAPYPTLSTAAGPGPVLPVLADHDHTGDAGDGGNIPAASVSGTAVTLSGDQTITGLKTLTGAAATEIFLNINSSDNALAASLMVVPTDTPGNISLPKSDEGDTTLLLGAFPEAAPAAGELVIGTAAADGHVEALAAPTAHQILAGNDAGTGPEWVAAEDIGIATEEYVNAAVAQVINVASGSTLTVGTQTSGTFSSTQVHDNTPWRVREAAATPGLNVELTFGATTAVAAAPTALWLRAYHNGQHTITVSIYKYTTSAWESYQVLPSAQSGYTFYSIPIPDGADHISSGGLARVQFAYTGEGSLDDYLYVDYCALVKGGQGSEKVDATRTWATKQTFPGDAYAPEMGKIELGHASDTTLTRVAAGHIAVEGNPVPCVVATDTHTINGTPVAFHTLLASAPVGVYRATWMFDITTASAEPTDLAVFILHYMPHTGGSHHALYGVGPQQAADYAITGEVRYIALSPARYGDYAQAVFVNADVTDIEHGIGYPAGMTGTVAGTVRVVLEYLGA